MVARDLILSDSGDVVLAQDEAFPREVIRVEFYVDTGYLIIIYDNEDSSLVEYELRNESQIHALIKAPRILLTEMIKGEPGNGYEVPLISIQG